MPLIFVGKDETDAPYENLIVPAASPSDDKVQAAYESATWPGTASKRATVPLHGQKLALAESAEGDDTAFAVQSLTFGARSRRRRSTRPWGRIQPLHEHPEKNTAKIGGPK